MSCFLNYNTSKKKLAVVKQLGAFTGKLKLIAGENLSAPETPFIITFFFCCNFKLTTQIKL